MNFDYGSDDLVYCFICHKILDREMFVVVLNEDDEMICMCKDHFENNVSPVSDKPRGINLPGIQGRLDK
jgi:hypothetical protein